MGCNYYELRSPWSSIRVEDRGAHTHITLWQAGGNAGTLQCVGSLTVDQEKRSGAISCFFGEVEVCKTTVNRDDVTLTVFQRPKRQHLMSEYGEVTTFDRLLSLYPRPRRQSFDAGAETQETLDAPDTT